MMCFPMRNSMHQSSFWHPIEYRQWKTTKFLARSWQR
jgi:hypothetical protein